MLPHRAPRLSTSIIHALEDAVFFGHVKEIDSFLDLVCEDDLFPQDLRNGLEALMYHRIHYGKGGDMEPAEPLARERMLLTEFAWGRELIGMIGHYPDMADMKYA